MKTIIASEFKAKCLKLMDDIAAGGEPIVVTKNGVPVGRFVPYHVKLPTLFGMHQGRVKFSDDLTAPLDEAWDVEE